MRRVCVVLVVLGLLVGLCGCPASKRKPVPNLVDGGGIEFSGRF